jgi:hypothetical protein
MSNTQTNWIFNLVDKVTGPIKDIVKGFSNMDNSFDAATLGVKKDIDELGKKLSGLKTKFDNTILIDERMKIRDEIARTESQISKLSKELSDLQKTGKKSAKGLFDDFGKIALNFNQITMSIQGVADSLAFGDEIGKLEQQVNQFVDGTPAQIKSITDEAYKLGQIYGDDSMQIVQAANAMTQNLGGTFEDNLKIIKEGYKKGANLNGNFIDQMREYPSVIGDMSVSADQMVAIIAQANKQGVWDDKAIDSIKEASIRLSDLNKEQIDLLNSMGIASADLIDQVSSGDIINPIKTISKGLEELDKSSQMKVLSKLFGGVGEDAKNVILSFKDYEASLTSMEDKTTEWQKSKEKFVGWMSDVKLAIFDTTKEWLPFIQFTAQGTMAVAQMGPAFSGLGQMFGGFGKGLKDIAGKLIKMLVPALGAATTAQTGFNIAAAANPIGLIVIAVVAAVAAITALVVYWDEVVEWFKSLPGVFKIMLAPIIAMFLPIIAIAYAIRKIIDNWDEIVAAFKSGFNTLKKWFLDLKSWFLDLGSWIAAHHPFKYLIDALDSIIPGLKAKLMVVWDTVKSELITPIREAIEGVFDWLFTSKESAPGKPSKPSSESSEISESSVSADSTSAALGLFDDKKHLAGDTAGSGSSDKSYSGGGSGAKSIVMNLYITNKFDAGAKLDSLRRQIRQVVEDTIVDAGRDAAVML